MATHQADVSVLFGVSAEPIPLPSDESLGSARGVNATTVEPTPLATRQPFDLIGLRLVVALRRLRSLGISTKVRVVAADGPLGSVVWQHPHVGSIVTVEDVVTLGVVDGTPVRVPDVVLSTESQARASLAAAGLAPGRRNPEPRPVTGRSEVVIRTFPRVGSLIPAGSRVDYDVIDTLFRVGRRPVGSRV